MTMRTEFKPSSRTLLSTILALGLPLITSPLLANGTTDVTDCGFVSTADGEALVLNQDLYADEGQRCIQINHDNVSLDCQGYSMTGFEGTAVGVLVTRGDYVSIENCAISDFGAGILLRGSMYGVVRNNESNDNDSNGIQVSNFFEFPGHMNEVSDNVANHNGGQGIFLGNSNEHLITGNTGNHNTIGIRVNNSNGNTIIDNSFNRNSTGMLLIAGADENEISHNTTNRNTAAGIRFFGDTDNNLFERNVANKNRFGISATGTNTGNVFNDNLCKNNSVQDETAPEFCK